MTKLLTGSKHPSSRSWRPNVFHPPILPLLTVPTASRLYDSRMSASALTGRDAISNIKTRAELTFGASGRETAVIASGLPADDGQTAIRGTSGNVHTPHAMEARAHAIVAHYGVSITDRGHEFPAAHAAQNAAHHLWWAREHDLSFLRLAGHGNAASLRWYYRAYADCKRRAHSAIGFAAVDLAKAEALAAADAFGLRVA